VVGGDCGVGNHHGTDYSDECHCWHGVMVVGCGRWSDISGHGYVCRMVIVVDVGVVEMLWN